MRFDGMDPRSFEQHMKAREQEKKVSNLGMIDKMLDLRFTPLSDVLLADPSRTSAAWSIHKDAVDMVLALLVPAVRNVAELQQPPEHGIHCCDRRKVLDLIGRPPVGYVSPRRQRGVL